MKSIVRLIIIVLVTFLFFMSVMVLIWYLKPCQKMNIYILDKSAGNSDYNEHQSFFWVLNNERIVKRNDESYNYKKDFYGLIAETSNDINAFESRRIRTNQIDSFSNLYDILYYTDAYGFNSETYNQTTQQTFVDAGLKQTDFLLLKEMVAKRKLILCEFNILGSPTSELVREKFNDLYGMKWNGWFGKYFSSLSESNPEIPRWIIDLYKSKNRTWNYSKDGIILVNPAQDVLVLEMGEELASAFPCIESSAQLIQKYSLPAKVDYSDWFEIIENNDTLNVDATLKLNTTASGDTLLKSNGLKNVNPVIVSYKNRMYYIAADFSHNQIFYLSSYMGTIEKWGGRFSSGDKKKYFFWNYYRPLMKGILNDYSKQNQ